MRFTKAHRQKIIDDYLAETASNMFVASEFVDWLAGQPEHEAYDLFFGADDATAAREYRIMMARNFVGGLHIVAKVEETKAHVVHITTREFPMFVSPVDGRKDGGGYVSFDPNDPTSVAELRRQGMAAMASWLRRYRGVFSEYDLTALDEIATGGGRVALPA